jgi:hypothetical protein
MKLTKFEQSYIECALWSSMDNKDEQGGEPLDANYSMEDFAEETLQKIRLDCAKFWKASGDLLDNVSDEMAGHDFWLTRNRHGAGFWDRGLGETGERLTKVAHSFGEVDLYIGDNGKIYV